MFSNLHEKNSIKETKIEDLASGGTTTKIKAMPQDIAHNIYSAVGFMEGKAYIEFFDEQTVIPYPWEVAQSPQSVKIPTAAIARIDLTEELAKHFIESGAQSREALLVFMNRNVAEDRALFCELIKKLLGSTASDIALLEDINKRLTITAITPDTVAAGSNINSNNTPAFINQDQFSPSQGVMLPMAKQNIHDEERRNDY